MWKQDRSLACASCPSADLETANCASELMHIREFFEVVNVFDGPPLLPRRSFDLPVEELKGWRADELFDYAAAQDEHRGKKVLQHRWSSTWSLSRADPSLQLLVSLCPARVRRFLLLRRLFVYPVALCRLPWQPLLHCHSATARWQWGTPFHALVLLEPQTAACQALARRQEPIVLAVSRRDKGKRQSGGRGAVTCRHVCLPVESLHRAAGSSFFQV